MTSEKQKVNENFTKRLYGKGQFKYSVENEILPEGFIRYHKNNFCNYFQISEEFFQNKNVLDTGCGPGKHAAVIALMGANVKAIDLSLDNIKKGQEIKEKLNLTNLEFQEYNLMHPISGQYDLISAHNWIQHSENPSVVLTNIASSLKLRGRLYLSTYQAGTFRFLISQVARSVLSKDDYGLMKKMIPYHFPQGFKAYNNPEDIYMENIFDDFFVPYCHSTDYDTIVSDAVKLGLVPLTDNPSKNIDLSQIDNIPLRIGFEKKYEPGKVIEEMCWISANDEFSVTYPEKNEILPIIFKVLEKIKETDSHFKCSFCLGLYLLRAQLNQVKSRELRYTALEKYLLSVLDESGKSFSYYYDTTELYKQMKDN